MKPRFEGQGIQLPFSSKAYPGGHTQFSFSSRMRPFPGGHVFTRKIKRLLFKNRENFYILTSFINY